MTLLNDDPADGCTSISHHAHASEICNNAAQPTAAATKGRYRTLAWLTAAAGLAYLCRPNGVTESVIRDELKLSLDQSGWLMGAFFGTYAVFQVPGGWFAERRGTRIALCAFATAWSMAMIAMGVAPVFGMLLGAQLVMGTAQAGMLPASYNSIGHWMPLSQRTLGCGVLGAGMQVGAIAASAIAARWIEPLGWRWIFVLFGIPGVIWAIGFFIRFRDRPSQALDVNASELALILAGREREEATPEVKTPESRELLSIARSSVMWWLCGQQICRSAGYMFFASWFPTFLQRTRGVSVEQSGYLQGVVLGGTLIGALFGGLLTDWIWRQTGNLRASRSGVGAVSLGICSIVILGAWLVQSTEVAVALLAFGGLIAALAGPCAFAAAIDIAGARVPQVSGMINMTGNIAAAACPVLVATLFKLTENWNLILLIFSSVYLAGAICWIFVNPQRRIQYERCD